MNLGMPEMIFILLLALVVVGPRKLPELARQLGKYMAEFKRASNEFKQQLESEMLNIELEERAKKAKEEPKVLPPEESAEDRVMRPIPETVGRSRAEAFSKLAERNGEPETQPLLEAPGEPLSSRDATNSTEPASPATYSNSN
jgi:Tat protein translocase TatB subunit